MLEPVTNNSTLQDCAMHRVCCWRIHGGYKSPTV